jgi:hypothetical protein
MHDGEDDAAVGDNLYVVESITVTIRSEYGGKTNESNLLKTPNSSVTGCPYNSAYTSFEFLPSASPHEQKR